MLDTLERFYIYRETQLGTQINDKLTVESNPIFEVLIHEGYCLLPKHVILVPVL